MLILHRKKGQAVVLDGNIRISVLETGADGAKLAVEAPKEVTVLREELIEAADANREAVADPGKLERIKSIKNIAFKK